MNDLATASTSQRIVAVDAVRGFAVCGILAMNIVSMGMPAYAYVDPHYYGGAQGPDLAAWALAYVLADGKMRALFTMLFGASLLLITDGAEGRVSGSARVHYARIFWLFWFGMVHAWLIWYGDILVDYAVAGAIAFPARKWRPSALAFAAFCLIGFSAIHSVIEWHDAEQLHALASQPDPPADAAREWNKIVAVTAPNPVTIGQELRLYRGGFADAFAARAPTTRLFQTTYLPLNTPETLGFVLLGMFLYRLGFWGGAWSRGAYRLVLAGGVAAVILYLPLAYSIVVHRFDPAFLPLADTLSLVLRPFLALAYAATIILMLQAGIAPRLMGRLAAAGRVAFSNYLGTSLVMTTIFYGYGFGWFGTLSRAHIYILVVGQWLLILAWSKPWLRRFRYGPFEWAWRSLARGEIIDLRRAIAS